MYRSPGSPVRGRGLRPHLTVTEPLYTPCSSLSGLYWSAGAAMTRPGQPCQIVRSQDTGHMSPAHWAQSVKICYVCYVSTCERINIWLDVSLDCLPQFPDFGSLLYLSPGWVTSLLLWWVYTRDVTWDGMFGSKYEHPHEVFVCKGCDLVWALDLSCNVNTLVVRSSKELLKFCHQRFHILSNITYVTCVYPPLE